MSSPAVGPARASLHDRRFRLLWSASAVSTVGSGVTAVAVPLIAVSSLHASVGQAAALTALSWLPNLLGPFIGSWVDRRRRPRAVTVAADLVRAVTLSSIPLAALIGSVSLVQLYLVVLVAGAASVFFATADARVFVLLLPRAEFVAAQGLMSTARAAADIAGPALGGVLAQAVGAPAAVGADAVSFLASAVLLARLPLRSEPAPAPEVDEALRPRLATGFRVLFGDPVLRAGLGSAATVNIFTFLVSGTLTVLFARRELHLTPGAIGLAYGAGAVGGVLAAALAPRVANRVGPGRTAVTGALVFPLSLLALAAAPSRHGELWFAAAEFVGGLGVMLYDVPLNAIEAAAIPDAVRSRVVGAFTAVNYGTRPIGAALGGVLSTAFGLRVTLMIAAIGGALSAVWLIASPVRRIRRIEA